MFLSQTFLLLFFVIFTTTEYASSSLHEIDNASAGSSDSGFHSLYTKINALERTLQNLERNVNEKTTYLDTLMRQVLLTVTGMETKADTGDFKNNNIKTNTMPVKNGKDTAVGFTARLTGIYNDTSSIIESYLILYDQGGAFNGTVFTCPSPGLYLFPVSVITPSDFNGIRIYKNMEQLTLAFSGFSPKYNGASVSAATWLTTGDEVYLRPHNSSLEVDFNSVFTGIKIISN